MRKIKLIHCSFDSVPIADFVPRIPKSRNALEEDKTPRICVAPTIRQCINAMPRAGNIIRFMDEIGMKVVIHAYYMEADNVLYDTKKYVPDADASGEMWILEKPKSVRCINYQLKGFSLQNGDSLDGKKFIYVHRVTAVQCEYQNNYRELIEGSGLNFRDFKKAFPRVRFSTIAGNASQDLTDMFRERRVKHENEVWLKMNYMEAMK